MAFLKKVNPDWQPQEKPGLQVNEVIDFSGPYEVLVRTGMAVLVDSEGNEIELPGQIFECPVCFVKIEGLRAFIDHVSTHAPKPKPVAPEEKKKTKKEIIRAKRLAALEKARAARKEKLAKK
jgi:hypothetical protein